MGQKWSKNGIFQLFWKAFVIKFFLKCSMLLKRKWYWSVFSYTNPISGKILFLELWLERLSIIHIAGFFDLIYLWMESVELVDCLYIGRELESKTFNLKFFVRCGLTCPAKGKAPCELRGHLRAAVSLNIA